MNLAQLLRRAARFLTRRARGLAARSAPSGARAPGHAEPELLARADEYNRNAEQYWRDAVEDPSAKERVLRRPFRSTDAPDVLFRVGLVFQELRAGAGHVVLDFGAGSCWLSSFLARMGCQTISVDVSPTAIALGKELFALENARNPWFEPQFHAYDGHRLPLGDDSVDRIVCFDAFHHIPNQSETLSEFYRVLRPGGRIVLSEPGEGHQHSEQAAHEVERFGVLENELDFQGLVGMASSLGFRGFIAKPYPSPATVSMNPEEYLDLLEGDVDAFPMETVRVSLRQSFVLAFDKGQFIPDSRAPGSLRGRIALTEAALGGPPGSVQQTLIRVRNVGDTTWLHEDTPYGGFVQVGGHLRDRAGKLIAADYLYRHALPRDLPPDSEVEMVLDVRLPTGVTECSLTLDLVDDGVTWFGQAGSETCDLILVPTLRSDPDRVPAYRASILTASAADGTLEALPGTRLRIPLVLRNTGRLRWNNEPGLRRGTMTVGGRIVDSADAVIGEIERAVLTQPVPAGQEARLAVFVQAPIVPGTYVTTIDLIREGCFWFGEVGSAPLQVRIRVSDRTPESTDPGLLRARIHAPPDLGAAFLVPSAEHSITLAIDNIGNTVWRHAGSAGAGFVSVGAHLYSADGDLLEWDFVHHPLRADVRPGETIDLSLVFRAPSRAGQFVLELDLVDEGITWFGARGSPTVRLPLVVRAP